MFPRALGFIVRAGSRPFSSYVLSKSNKLRLGGRAIPLAVGTAIVCSGLAFRADIWLDLSNDEFKVDPATSIAFPTVLRIPSKTPLPIFTLIGLGVRTVSFLGIKVYSIGFYADLQNPNLNLSGCTTRDEKIQHLVRNTACVLRINGFMRSLQTRLNLARKQGTLSEEEEQAVQAPLRKLKSIFPNTPLNKHTPFDILLTAPSSDPAQLRALVIRDMGSVENDWVATEFVLAYFEGSGPSPSLKKSVVEGLAFLDPRQELKT